MEKIQLKVSGMDCTNCALSIRKQLEKKGLQNVKVNFIGGDVSFDANEKVTKEEAEKAIDNLGYKVEANNYGSHAGHNHEDEVKGTWWFTTHFQRFVFCAIFTLPLMVHMIPGIHIHFLMNPIVQLGLCIPVYIVGMDFFGRSAFKSIMAGIPNMNVLVAVGATAAFGYSLYGTITGQGDKFLFYETTATILTLVFLGNWMEDKSIATTQAALKKLVVSQKVTANMIAFDDKYQEQVFSVDSSDLKTGDLILIKSGEQVPADCKILWGDASVSEAIITGESLPVTKAMGDKLIGGSILENGTVKAQVTAAGKDTVMSHILEMVRDAQAEKPPVQQLADRISAIFVPVVLGIAAITFLGNYFIGTHGFTESLLRSIAVLVIACPCAMGLATPAAIAVGLGRAARNGVLFKNAKSLEVFKDIKQVVFDKTGTLTTGNFKIISFTLLADDMSEEAFKALAFSLEKYSNHPVAKAISKEWKIKGETKWKQIDEVKGLGMKATDKEGNAYMAASYKAAATFTKEDQHSIYIIKNNKLIGFIDVADEVREEAKQIIQYLKTKNIKNILLSGDKKEKCEAVATMLGIDEVISEQTPEQKLKIIADLSATQPTAMVGDGINDAPALAKATVGISLSEASQVAMQSAQVVLMNSGLTNLPLALGLGRHTFLTIKSNLFWAFAYNIVAIPVAAFGLLGTYGPTYGALIMGLSDVVLAINSLLLRWKKVV